MKQTNYMILGVAILVGVLALGPAVAAQPASLDDTGKIDRVNVERGEIVLDDSYYVLAGRLRVYASNRAPVSATVLKKGMTIGYITAKDDSGRELITDILILSID